MNIYIKAWFSDWKEATIAEAKEFISHIMNGWTRVYEDTEPRLKEKFNKKVKLVEEKHLKGITIEELFKGANEDEENRN